MTHETANNETEDIRTSNHGLSSPLVLIGRILNSFDWPLAAVRSDGVSLISNQAVDHRILTPTVQVLVSGAIGLQRTGYLGTVENTEIVLLTTPFDVGGVKLSIIAVRQIAPADLCRGGMAGAVSVLSPRQYDIAAAVASGSTNQEIADVVGCSVALVKKEILRIRNKVGAQNRAEVASWFSRASAADGWYRESLRISVSKETRP